MAGLLDGDDGDGGSMWRRAFPFATAPGSTVVVHIEEEFAGEAGLGGTVWGGAALTGHMLADGAYFARGWWAGCRALELGAGCGLCACLVAKLGGRAVATDVPETMTVLQDNLDLNLDADGRAREGDGRATACPLVWGEPLPRAELLDGGAPFALVLASMCVYYEEAVLPLLRTSHELCLGPLASAEPGVLAAEEAKGWPAGWSMRAAAEVAGRPGAVLLCGLVSVEGARAFWEHVGELFEVYELFCAGNASGLGESGGDGAEGAADASPGDSSAATAAKPSSGDAPELGGTDDAETTRERVADAATGGAGDGEGAGEVAEAAEDAEAAAVRQAPARPFAVPLRRGIKKEDTSVDLFWLRPRVGEHVLGPPPPMPVVALERLPPGFHSYRPPRELERRELE